MAINRKRSFFYWYKVESQGRHIRFTWNTWVSYTRVLIMVSALALCVSNHVVLAVIDLIVYLVFYFSYLMKNYQILLIIQQKDQVEKIVGNRYSFRHPLKISIKGSLSSLIVDK
ncbi:MAG: hypothetical protein ABF912_06800 [Lacticaseibacillus paracasei]